MRMPATICSEGPSPKEDDESLQRKIKNTHRKDAGVVTHTKSKRGTAHWEPEKKHKPKSAPNHHNRAAYREEQLPRQVDGLPEKEMLLVRAAQEADGGLHLLTAQLAAVLEEVREQPHREPERDQERHHRRPHHVPLVLGPVAPEPVVGLEVARARHVFAHVHPQSAQTDAGEGDQEEHRQDPRDRAPVLREADPRRREERREQAPRQRDRGDGGEHKGVEIRDAGHAHDARELEEVAQHGLEPRDGAREEGRPVDSRRNRGGRMHQILHRVATVADCFTDQGASYTCRQKHQKAFPMQWQQSAR